MTKAKHLIVGCGDIGSRVATLLQATGQTVRGVVATQASVERLDRQGIDAVAVDLDRASDAAVAALQADSVLWFAPPPKDGERDPRIRRWLDLAPAPQRLVYLSTPAVYGDCGGRWIDEQQAIAPQTPRGMRRADAEAAVLAASARRGFETVRLRVPGIYGPDRLPIARLRSRQPVVVEAEAPWSNRIHADDLATSAVAALERGRDGAVYHISDGHPTTMTDWFVRCAQALDLPEPPRVTLAEAMRSFSPALLSFLRESRRMDNRRLREELGVTLRFPTLAHFLESREFTRNRG